MVDSVYNYYLSTYAHKTNARYDTHTKEQLKNIFGRIVKNNSQAPTYQIDFSNDAVKYAIDLKEHARELNAVVNELSDTASGEISFKKSARSSRPDCILATYVGGSCIPDINELNINISQTATKQINISNFLQPDKRIFKVGEYSFDLAVNNLTYQFEFNVDRNETVKDVQDKIVRLINNSNISLTAEVTNDSLGNTAISICSDATGISLTKSVIFNFMANDNTHSQDFIDTLGLNHVSQYPSNAIYTINGKNCTSPVNNIVVNKAFNLQLLKPTGQDNVTVSLADDGEAIAENIDELVTKYNSLLSFTNNDDNSKFEGNGKLQRTLQNVAYSHESVLKSNGINVNDNGTITLDKAAIISSADNGSINDVFDTLASFLKDIKVKADNITVNPMDYVNNKIIAYKNPKLTLTDPYNLSAYSGILFNVYI